MRKISLNITPKFRLDLNLVARRGKDQGEPILPKLEELRRVRSGMRISRFFRHIFEHKRIKQILGSNIAFAILATSIASPQVPDILPAEQNIVRMETPLTTISSGSYPLETVVINQGYRLYHQGIDFEGETGDSITPILAGKIERVQYLGSGLLSSAYGNAILINHGNELTSLYAHLSEITVKEGQKVEIDTTIGKVGSTGHSTGSHLHLEVRESGYPINPLTILSP